MFLYPAFNPNEVWAEGPGVEPEGMLVKQKASFVVHTENAGNAKLEVKCIGPRKYSLLGTNGSCNF